MLLPLACSNTLAEGKNRSKQAKKCSSLFLWLEMGPLKSVWISSFGLF